METVTKNNSTNGAGQDALNRIVEDTLSHLRTIEAEYQADLDRLKKKYVMWCSLVVTATILVCAALIILNVAIFIWQVMK